MATVEDAADHTLDLAPGVAETTATVVTDAVDLDLKGLDLVTEEDQRDQDLEAVTMTMTAVCKKRDQDPVQMAPKDLRPGTGALVCLCSVRQDR